MSNDSFPNPLHALDQIGRPRLFVVGDLILDRYTFGDAVRISPEAPVIVLQSRSSEVRPGGAASVALLLRGLGAEVCLAGVVGSDPEGDQLRQLIEQLGVDGSCILTDVNRPTTTKDRFLGSSPGRHPHQILRVDREICDPLAPPLEQELNDFICRRLNECDALLISDYSKGVCTFALLSASIATARALHRPILVDPARVVDYSRYHGATLLKPNRAEVELASQQRIHNPGDAIEIGRELCARHAFDSVVVTLDRDGMVVAQSDGQCQLIPTDARDISDITGAGDMVLAMLGISVASGLSLIEAARLANVAAGLEVERVGVSIITKNELRTQFQRAAVSREPQGVRPHPTSTSAKMVAFDELSSLAGDYRRSGRTIVFTNGCFDLLHAGHVGYLREAAALGDVLIVGLNSDHSVRQLKGPGRPIVGEIDRADMLAAIDCVDHVILFAELTPHRLLEALQPDVLAKGGTYTVDQVVGREIVTEYGGTVSVVGLRNGISTSKLIADIQSRAETPAAPNLEPE